MNKPADNAKKPNNAKKLKFADGEKPIKPNKKAAQSKSKPGKSREKLPAAKTVKDAENPKSKLTFNRGAAPGGTRKFTFKPAEATKLGALELTRSATGKLHQKVSEVEHENVGIEAGHRIEQAAESVYHSGKRTARSALTYVRSKPYRTAAKMEKKILKANIKRSYRDALNKNPKLKSNAFSRFMQKRKIKKQYAKAAREAKRAAQTAKKTGQTATKVLKSLVRFIKSNPKVILILLIILLLVFFAAALFSAIGGLGGGGFPAFIASTYLAEDSELNQASLAYSEWETDLRLQALDAEASHPGYDEYRYNIGGTGHNPNELAAFLTAVYGEFTYADIESVLQEIFAEQYQLEFTPSVEVRYRTVITTNIATGESYETTEAYDWHVMTVTLTSRPMTDVIFPYLSGDQVGHFGILTISGGNRQHVGSPFDFNWLPFISSYYGYRVHPITGVKDLHLGIDIALSAGIEIRSVQDGVVTFAGNISSYGNIVIIENGDGIMTRYAHCDTLLVISGQTVAAGDIIATVGNTGNSTGNHLHFEVLHNGEYVNPLFFAHSGN